MKLSKKTLFFFVLFFIICILILHFYKSRGNCVNPFEVKNFIQGNKIIQICNNILFVGSIKVVSDKEFPDLFRYSLNKDSKPYEVVQYIRNYKERETELISFVSTIDSITWNKSAIGIFRKEKDGEYKLIFKREFKDNQGRWVDINFGIDYVDKDPYFFLRSKGSGFSIKGDIGMLGCYGACRMPWQDFYDWDDNKGTYVIVNNEKPEIFKKLMNSYDNLDKSTCQNKIGESLTISELYPIRKDKLKFCSDTSEVPYTTNTQAKNFLKAKKAIQMIINGKNLSSSDISKINLGD